MHILEALILRYCLREVRELSIPKTIFFSLFEVSLKLTRALDISQPVFNGTGPLQLIKTMLFFFFRTVYLQDAIVNQRVVTRQMLPRI